MNKTCVPIIIAMLFLVAVSGCAQQGQQPQGGTGGAGIAAADVNASVGLGSDINQLDEIQSDLNASEIDSLASDMDEVAGI